MSSLKCAHCGLVNFATAPQCRRCRTPFVQNVSPVAGATVQGVVLADGYVLPPPPTIGTVAGVWRDKTKLVVSKGTPLPDRCVKCNALATGPKLKKKLTWHHPAIYLLILVGFLVYVVVAMIVRKTVTVELGLCDEHKAKRQRSTWITTSLILLGVGGFIMAVLVGENVFLLTGIVLILAGIVYGISALKIVTATRIDARFAWLKGVNTDYLAGLPQWPGA